MIGDISRAEHIYIVCGYTDMRKAIDGLAAIVQQNFKLDVFSGSLFLFCGKRCDRIKALLWEEDGFVLLYKRLENGKYKWLKLSITLDTLTARILKLSSDSQSRIEPTPFYSWWNPADCRADPAVAPVAHEISPDHRF